MTLITGAVKIKNLPTDFAITDVISLVKFIEAQAAVQFNASQITNLVISVDAPDATNRNTVWWRLNNAGSFVGLFTYIGSAWVQAFPVPSGVFKIYGNSGNIPTGYVLVSESIPGFTAAMVNKLKEGWQRDPTDSFWIIFDVVYIGL